MKVGTITVRIEADLRVKCSFDCLNVEGQTGPDTIFHELTDAQIEAALGNIYAGVVSIHNIVRYDVPGSFVEDVIDPVDAAIKLLESKGYDVFARV